MALYKKDKKNIWLSSLDFVKLFTPRKICYLLSETFNIRFKCDDDDYDNKDNILYFKYDINNKIVNNLLS